MTQIEEREADQAQRAPTPDKIGRDLSQPDLSGEDPNAAFARLFDEHARPLRGYLAGRVGVHAADDLVAETFLVAMRRRATYDPSQAPIRGWLYGIATNLARTHLRQEIRGYRATARAHSLHEAGTTQAHDGLVAERVDAQRHTRRLADALAGLSEPDREVLLLTSWAGLEPVEVAAALGVPASTVRSRLHRVRQKLQALLVETPHDQEDRDV